MHSSLCINNTTMGECNTRSIYFSMHLLFASNNATIEEGNTKSISQCICYLHLPIQQSKKVIPNLFSRAFVIVH